jgi:hypothetical protein
MGSRLLTAELQHGHLVDWYMVISALKEHTAPFLNPEHGGNKFVERFVASWQSIQPRNTGQINLNSKLRVLP